MPEVSPAAPVLRRLTQSQYQQVVSDLFSHVSELVLPTSLEPDIAVEGLLGLGAASTTISAWGVEQYESAAFLLVGQALSEENRDAFVACTPAATVDADCARSFFTEEGLKIWRRPLSEDELNTVVSISGNAAEILGDFYKGLEYGLVMLLQSPNFLYRVELGEDAGDGTRRYTAFELATRLSFFLWNTTPDDQLLSAAADGSLLTDAGLETEVRRMLADARAREGVRVFFTDMLTLYLLDELSKDPTIFIHMSPEVGPSAREETLLGLEQLIFERNGDYRELAISQTTFLDRKLSAIYNVQAPAREGFGETTLEKDGGRRGILGQLSFLALASHPVSTSATRRGMFIREILLCQTVQSPPADLNTSIPEASEDAPTLKDRVQTHLTDPTCAACHSFTDPIGLSLENFDGLGSWRSTENGVTIDPSGELDGEAFADAWDLGGALYNHQRFPSCLSKTMYQYAVGHRVSEGEEELSEYLAESFKREGYTVLGLLYSVATSHGFRLVGPVE
jgi:hypothetical protein